MSVDPSALLAILRGEPEAAACAQAIAKAKVRRISAANLLEAAIVIDGSRDPVASRRFDDLVREAELVIEPVTESQARMARRLPRFREGQRTRGPTQLRRCVRLRAGEGSRRNTAL
jgi:ribonuclease VapC